MTCRQAAAETDAYQELLRLREENKRLREALEKISTKQHFEVLKNTPESIERFTALKEQGDVAREALEKK